MLGNLETLSSPHFRIPSFLPDSFNHNSDPALPTSFRRPDGRNTFTALSTANNHALDYGDLGLTDTLDFLETQGIARSGVRRQASEPTFTTFTVGGIRFGFFAACQGFNDPKLAQETRLHISVVPELVPCVQHPVDLSLIREAMDAMTVEKLDVKVVCMHWGHEFEFYPTPDLVQVGREIVRMDADVVFGGHSHVIQPIEICLVKGYEKRDRDVADDPPALTPERSCLLEDASGAPRKAIIAYCLGNLATNLYGLHCEMGIILGLDFHRDEQTGRVDWETPKPQFVLNVRRHPVCGIRRLVLLGHYLREREAVGDLCAPERKMRAYLHGHLFGAATDETAHSIK